MHAVNPTRVSWEDVRDVVRERLDDACRKSETGTNKDVKIKMVPWKEWVAALRDVASLSLNAEGEAESQAVAVSGLKLLDFFESLSSSSTGTDNGTGRGTGEADSDAKGVNTSLNSGVFDMGNTLKASPTLARLGPVGHFWMGLWLDQWGY